MIADLDETIRQLLIAELPVKNGEIDIRFDQPTREWSAKLNKPTVNLFLYDLRENNTLRQHQWERMANGDPLRVAQKRSPMRVDCRYMLTTWAGEPDDEHRLMTRTLMALFRYPVLPEDLLVGTLQNPVFDLQTRLAAHDVLTNPAEVWSALDNELRPSVSYTVTLALDPWAEVSGPAVRSYILRTGQKTPQRIPTLQAGTETEMGTLGGTVRQKNNPVAGAQVALKGTGFVSETDENGRYTLGAVPPGSYTLVIWPPNSKKPKETAVTFPAGSYDLDL